MKRLLLLLPILMGAGEMRSPSYYGTRQPEFYGQVDRYGNVSLYRVGQPPKKYDYRDFMGRPSSTRRASGR